VVRAGRAHKSNYSDAPEGKVFRAKQPAGLAASFDYALRGIASIFATERNAQIELGATLLVAAACILFRIQGWQLVALIACCVSVLSLELLNSALEAVVDLVSPVRHPLAARAKDAAAGAVLVAAVGSLIIGLLVLVPHFELLSFAFTALGSFEFLFVVVLSILALGIIIFAISYPVIKRRKAMTEDKDI
jgi:diacylglycerol kinase